MYDDAEAAVAAALAAGARYADARVMHIRTEAMSARDGILEALDREERAGVGARALIGSSWGFFAVPDAGNSAARRAGERRPHRDRGPRTPLRAAVSRARCHGPHPRLRADGPPDPRVGGARR